MWPLVLATQTPLHIPCYLPLHEGPPITKSQIPIHLGGSRVNQEPRLMIFLQYYLSNLTREWEPNPTTPSQKPMTISSKSVNPGLSNQIQKCGVNGHPQLVPLSLNTILLEAQSIDNHIGLPRMIENLIITILNHVKPSVLPHVQIRLIHKIHQALVIHVNGTSNPI